MKAKSEKVTNYWAEFYLERNMCSLCGNSGVIDTRGVMTAAKVPVGRKNLCICPNGQALRHHGVDPNAVDLREHGFPLGARCPECHGRSHFSHAMGCPLGDR